jgi:hypothetical protein
MSRSAMPWSCQRRMIAPMAWLLSSSAARAVAAWLTTPMRTTARSGLALTSPTPRGQTARRLKLLRGGGHRGKLRASERPARIKVRMGDGTCRVDWKAGTIAADCGRHAAGFGAPVRLCYRARRGPVAQLVRAGGS